MQREKHATPTLTIVQEWHGFRPAVESMALHRPRLGDLAVQLAQLQEESSDASNNRGQDISTDCCVPNID